MIGRTSATKIVVVHAWQVVMNKRVRMNHLDCARESDRGFKLAADALARGHREHRPEPLAAREQAVTHRLVQASRRAAGLIYSRRQLPVNQLRALFQITIEV